jgi:hypothetical protein
MRNGLAGIVWGACVLTGLSGYAWPLAGSYYLLRDNANGWVDKSSELALSVVTVSCIIGTAALIGGINLGYYLGHKISGDKKYLH